MMTTLPWLVLLAVVTTASGPWFGLLGSPVDLRRFAAGKGLFVTANIATASTLPIAGRRS